jgi:hypothetical protein
VLGFLDPSQVDRPVLELNTQSSGPSNALNTIGDVSTLDIGESSDLVIDVLSFSKNRLHYDNFLIRHPFNSA